MDIRQRWHGAPLWVWIGGGTTLAVTTAILVRRYRAARSAQSAGGTLSATNPYGPLPGWEGLSQALSSPVGKQIGTDSLGYPVYGTNGTGMVGPPETPGATDVVSPAKDRFQSPGPAKRFPAVSPPAPTVSSGMAPANRYQIGQSVGNIGERIVSTVYSPLYGWLNLTSLGGIYTGGGGTGSSIAETNYGGSYLGYLGSMQPAAQKIEQAGHGDFSKGGLSLLPGGGYVETNSRGETYIFGH